MKRALALALLLVGCRSEAHEPALAARTQATKTKPVQKEKAAPWSCGAVHEGARLSRPALGQKKRADGAIAIGLIADTREAKPETLGNLARFSGVFRSEQVAAVVALGGLESTEQGIAEVLLALKGAGAPVFALPGDREPEKAFHAGVERARQAGLDVTDLALARAIAGSGLAILSLPGYRWPHYLTAGDFGCSYKAADVAALAGLDAWLAADRTRPILLVAYAPPRGDGPGALDWALGGANVGDSDLARLLPSLHVRVGAFAHVDEAGGRQDDGKAPVPDRAWSERLYVNVGAADAVPHELWPSGLSRGQAMVVEIKDGKARGKVIR